jgi:hypothetical protein
MHCSHGHTTIDACPICRREQREQEAAHTHETSLRGRPSILGGRASGWISGVHQGNRKAGSLFIEKRESAQTD